MIRHSTGRLSGDRPQQGLVARTGFTFFEILVVLSLIVLLAAIVTPNLLALYRKTRVREAADLVRETLATSRTLAIDGGIDYQFLFEPSGQKFVVIPAELQPVGNNNQTQNEQTVRMTYGEIAEIFRIEPADGVASVGQSLGPEWFGSLPNATALSQVTWSPPILFRFDGSADDAEFRVVGEEKRTVVLTVRGLTGAVSMSQTLVEAD